MCVSSTMWATLPWLWVRKVVPGCAQNPVTSCLFTLRRLHCHRNRPSKSSNSIQKASCFQKPAKTFSIHKIKHQPLSSKALMGSALSSFIFVSSSSLAARTRSTSDLPLGKKPAKLGWHQLRLQRILDGKETTLTAAAAAAAVRSWEQEGLLDGRKVPNIHIIHILYYFVLFFSPKSLENMFSRLPNKSSQHTQPNRKNKKMKNLGKGTLPLALPLPSHCKAPAAVLAPAATAPSRWASAQRVESQSGCMDSDHLKSPERRPKKGVGAKKQWRNHKVMGLQTCYQLC